MLERVRATVCIWQYETKGRICAIRGTIVVWSLSIVYTIYVILSALADTDTFGQPMGVVYLTSKYNATIILYTYYLILFIATITTICDFVIYRINKTFKKRNKTSFTYSLSANYQLNENLLAMRFILPLDASYALFFGLYLISVAVLRIYRDKLGDVNYISFYCLATMLPLLHSFITLFIYICFLKRIQRRKILKNKSIGSDRTVIF
uniref:Uncharacterized protein n=1 Tax=Meloidogyne enterolobii TaxID=390850 RepID=A0A6V7W6Y4_MELEN|nr:unnamed protein product [Meloidogyne enterolobii]